ncbi:MAG: response regulator [Gammaproteobacteria bacterium]|nr:response regulator [Gammaproteobacteria bacterium]
MKRVLVVDDNEDLADGLSMILDDEGYEVYAAYDGKMALEKAREGFDLAFVDIKLPDTNGVTLFSQLTRTYPKSKVILMTGFRIEQVLETVSNGNPVAVLRSNSEPDKVVETAKANRHGIVLVDNPSLGFAEQLKQAISASGAKAAIVTNGEQALDAHRQSTNIIIYELDNTVISGLAEYINIRDQLSGTTVIFLIGEKLNSEQGIDPLRSLSITGCIYKPFDPDQVMDILQRAA